MKTIRTFSALLVLFILPLKMAAIQPAGTYTFVNPCMPFAIITAIPNSYGCYSFSVNTAGASDPNGYFNWDFGDGSTALGNYVYHCYSPGPGTINFTVTVGYNSAALCGPLPTQNTYTLALSPPAQTLCVGNSPSVSISALTASVWVGATIPEMMFSFLFGDGSAATMSTNAHTYPNCGNYVIEVKSWDMNMPQNVCYSYAAVNISCPTGTITGIPKNTHENRMTLFPNPSKDFIHISSHNIINGIKVVDITGRELFSKEKIHATEMILPILEFPAGTYFLKCTDENGQERHIKFCKE